MKFINLWLCLLLLNTVCYNIVYARSNSGIMHSILSDTVRNARISGRITDQKNGLGYSTISLLHAKDSSAIKKIVSDTEGFYSFTNLNAGVYLIKAENLGYQVGYSSRIELKAGQNMALDAVVLKSLAKTLNEVSISTSRAPIVKKADRYVFNVENSPMAAGNSIQLFKSAPFVEVSADNKVSLQGKKTLILIDNKPVADAALADILLSLPAESISQVDLITNPSSRYDAAYGAVINITTKKAKTDGLTGTLRTEGSYGDFGRLNTSGNITFKTKALTVFAMAGYNRFNFQAHDNLDRKLNQVKPSDLIHEEITRTFYQNIYNFQGGANLQTGKNQSVGLLVEGQINNTSGTFKSSDNFSKEGLLVDSTLYTNSPFTNKPSNYSYNVNYSLRDDSAKNELFFLATFTPVRRTLEQYFRSVLLNPQGETLRTPLPYRSTNSYTFNIWIAQLDYSHLFKKQWKLETGLKYQNTDSKQIMNFEKEEAGQLVMQPENSSNNHLSEAIFGGYGILSKDWKKDKLQFGLRLENTQVSNTINFSQNYFKLFPTLMYQHVFNDTQEISFSYKRTINRVPYDQLVPYILYINQYTVFEGNPLLKPQYDNTFSLNTRLNKLSILINYTSSKGMLAQYPIRQDFENKITHIALQNLDKSEDFTVDISYPLVIAPWWSTQNSGTVFGWSNANGRVLNQPFNLSGVWFAVQSNHTFKFSSNISLEVDGYYRSSKKVELTYNGSNGNINAGLLIKVLNNKGQIRIGAEDILKRNVYYTSQDFGVYSSQRNRSFDSRRATIGLTYNFGQSKVKKPVKKLGNEDAVDRL
jgi:iron complex outermembrane receptor protein